MRSTPLRAPPSRGLVLAMLLIVYTFNFLDRQMLGILAQPIKADLGLSDAQFGAIGGLAFAILYSVLGVPLRSEEHTSELQSLMRNSYAVFCLKKKKETNT